MPELDLDLKDAVSFADVPPGSYPCIVKQFSDVKTAGTGTRYVKVFLEISGHEEYDGDLLSNNLMLEGAGAGFFRDFWKAATDEDLEGDDIRVNTDDAIGASVVAIVTQQEYPKGSGEFRPQVDRIVADRG